MDAVFGFLNRPLFGLPIWIWLLVVAGGILVAKFIIPKITGTSSSTSGGTSSDSLGSGVTSGGVASQPALDQSTYDPNTGIPLSVENAINPATGLPNYNNLVGLQNTTSSIASSQGNPTTGGGTGTTTTTTTTPPSGADLNTAYTNAYNALQANPSDTSLQAALQSATSALQQRAVADWQTRYGITWTGGAGTYPAGWVTAANVPGARVQ